MTPRIVLLSGKQGSGKTSIQKALADAWDSTPGRTAIIVNFADIIYEMHDAIREIGDRYGLPRKEPKDGPLLQLLGTEWGRKTVGENVWVDALRAKIKGVFDAYDSPLLIVGDCRFENEFDSIPEAFRVRLECPEEVRKPRCSMWRENSNHPSEVGLDRYAEEDKFDLYLYTDVIPVGRCLTFITKALEKGTWLNER